MSQQLYMHGRIPSIFCAILLILCRTIVLSTYVISGALSLYYSSVHRILLHCPSFSLQLMSTILERILIRFREYECTSNNELLLLYNITICVHRLDAHFSIYSKRLHVKCFQLCSHMVVEFVRFTIRSLGILESHQIREVIQSTMTNREKRMGVENGELIKTLKVRGNWYIVHLLFRIMCIKVFS